MVGRARGGGGGEAENTYILNLLLHTIYSVLLSYTVLLLLNTIYSVLLSDNIDSVVAFSDTLYSVFTISDTLYSVFAISLIKTAMGNFGHIRPTLLQWFH